MKRKEKTTHNRGDFGNTDISNTLDRSEGDIRRSEGERCRARNVHDRTQHVPEFGVPQHEGKRRRSGFGLTGHGFDGVPLVQQDVRAVILLMINDH